jgi:DNA-directed RNA polymerase specialized sigma24 family protein
MVIAMKKWTSFDPSLALEPWLWGIARNRVRDFRDLARHRVEVATDVVPEHATSDDADVLLARRLQRGLQTLADEVQVIVVLHDLESWTLPECARCLGITVDVAKYRLSVGRQALRKHLEPGGPRG